jgi:AraC-like DNA-binding protein
MQGEVLMRQPDRLDLLHDKADNYLHELGTQRVISWLAIGIIILFIVVFVLFYLYHLRKISMQRERVVNTLWNMKPEEVPAVADGDEVVERPEASEDAEVNEPAAVSNFITRFKEVVESRLADSDISVEDLAADMNLSRVQLYRKVKAVTGSSPVELLRTARLNRAYQILLTTDKSVSEVAYDVGFTAPSYFTKCFKEEYGMVPGDVKK